MLVVEAPMKSFNPCCIGLGIQTLFDLKNSQTLFFVSILVVLDWVFKRRAVSVRRFTNVVFQSLLYWIGYSNKSLVLVVEAPMKSFNPCCIGLGIQTSSAVQPPASIASGFNPCCIGLGIQTSASSRPAQRSH